MKKNKQLMSIVLVSVPMLLLLSLLILVEYCNINSKSVSSPGNGAAKILTSLAVKDVELGFKPLKDYRGAILGMQLADVMIILQDATDISVGSIDASVSVDGKEYRPNCISLRGDAGNSLRLVKVSIAYPPLIQSGMENTHVAKVTLFYGGHNAPLAIEKVFSAPKGIGEVAIAR